MARTRGMAPNNKLRPSSSKANAAGYARRHLRKTEKLTNISDVYEYQPGKVGRPSVGLELSRDEAAGFGRDGNDSEGEEGELKARLVDQDEKLDSEDDEELDSDEAFEESDEDRFAGFSFTSAKASSKKARTKTKQKTPGRVRFADVDLNEDDSSYNGNVREDEDSEVEEDMREGGADDEFIDVLDVLDGKGEADVESDSGESGEDDARNTQRQEDSEKKSGGEEESGDNLDEDEDSAESDGDEDLDFNASDTSEAPGALDELANLISALDHSKKRKSADDTSATGTTQVDQDNRPRKRRVIAERTEAGMENEFRTRSSGPKLDLNDLLAPLASQSSNLLSLKKSTKVLASSSVKTLPAPLPQRTHERLDREAAYEQTKGEVDKWSSTMKRIREAEHLSFPLQAKPPGRVSNLELAAKFKPTTEMESSVDKLLKSAKIREEDIEKTEELKMNHLSPEEIANRRAELRRMRELLFRSEVKAKRIAKIKSKTYRRLKKQERAKLSAKVDGEVDEDDEAARMKREMERAKERATLRHKHTGKWAKAMMGRNELDADERRDISVMLERGELLREKIRGDKEDGSGNDDEDDSNAEEDESNVSRIKADAFEELSKLGKNDADAGGSGTNGMSFFGLKFMKEGMARDQQRVNRMADDFIAELGGDQCIESEIEAAGEEANTLSNGVAIERKGGRVTYRPGHVPSQQLVRSMGSLTSDTSSVTLTSTDIPPVTRPEPSPTRPVPLPTVEDSNPWLVHDDTPKVPRKKNEVLVEKESATNQKSKNKLKKQASKREEVKNKAREDAVVEISMSNVMTLSGNVDPLSSTPPTEPQTQGDPTDTPKASGDDSDINSEVEEQEKALIMKGKGKAKGLKAFEQRDLVALAFAGDNVVQKFEDAKRREITEDAPREVDTTLPGWGSWGGVGTRRQPSKPHLIKKVAGVDPKSRADYNKSHVIISEKRDKKAAKYMVKDLPYPFTSKAQFERSMDTPLGIEWNTRVGFQRGTLPKVVKKMGQVIDPLQKFF